MAEVSAQDLWQDAQALIASEGAQLTARENRRGDALVLSRPVITFPEGGSLTLPDITLREVAGGAVRVELPPQFPLVLDLPPNTKDAPDRLSLTVSAPDFALTLRDLGAMTVDFDLSASSLTASLDPFVMPQGGNRAPDLFLAFALADLDLKHRHNANPDQMGADTTLALGTAHAEMRVNVPDENLNTAFSLDLSAIAGAFKGHIPADAQRTIVQAEPGQDPDFATFVDLLDKGLLLDFRLTHGAASLMLDIANDPSGMEHMSLSTADGSATLALDRTAFLYEALSGASRLALRGQMPDLPLPEMEISWESYGAKLKFGLPGGGTWGSKVGQANSGSDAPKGPPGWGEWAVAYGIRGLAVSPALWDLADPGRVLPRDPLSLVADLSGSYTLDPAALQPGYVSKPEAPPPFTEITLKLAEFLLSGAGASLTGTGDMAVDFTAMQTVNDVPRGNGSLTFVTEGANALLDRLASLGLLSEDELTSARFGLMFIGKLEGGADRLVTRLEFSGDSFSLNGQRIR